MYLFEIIQIFLKFTYRQYYTSTHVIQHSNTSRWALRKVRSPTVVASLPRLV